MKKLLTLTIAALTVVGMSAQGAVLTSQLGVLDLDANSGLNPATGAAWQAGDTYRLVFVTSGFTAVPTSTDIATYNAEVTAYAQNRAEFVGTTWTAIGSTATVDARDNTGTNPSSTGVGIFLVDSQIVADNNATLWSAVGNTPGILTAIDLDENGAAFNTGTPWGGHGVAWTGTDGDGTVHTGQELGDVGGDVVFGLTTQVNQHWIDRGNNVDADTTNNGLLYGMSDTLTVVPEPSVFALMIAGFGVCLVALRRRRN
jgi:hypothetical protein